MGLEEEGRHRRETLVSCVSEGGDAGEEWGLPLIKQSGPPEVPTVVGHTLSRAVGGRGLQDDYLHLLAGVALDRGHGALPLP